jgi:hypothetical protein
MEKSWLYSEIFGSDLDEIAPTLHPKPIPDLPIDDPLFTCKASTGAGDGLRKRIESDELTSLLIGSTRDAARTPDSERVLHKFEGILSPKTDSEFLHDVLSRGRARLERKADRKAEIAKGDARRQREIAAIIDKWADRHGIDTIAGIGRLLENMKNSAAQCLRDILMEVAA